MFSTHYATWEFCNSQHLLLAKLLAERTLLNQQNQWPIYFEVSLSWSTGYKGTSINDVLFESPPSKFGPHLWTIPLESTIGWHHLYLQEHSYCLAPCIFTIFFVIMIYQFEFEKFRKKSTDVSQLIKIFLTLVCM